MCADVSSEAPTRGAIGPSAQIRSTSDGQRHNLARSCLLILAHSLTESGRGARDPVQLDGLPWDESQRPWCPTDDRQEHSPRCAVPAAPWEAVAPTASQTVDAGQSTARSAVALLPGRWNRCWGIPDSTSTTTASWTSRLPTFADPCPTTTQSTEPWHEIPPNVEVPGGTMRSGLRLFPNNDTRTSLYLPFEVEAMAVHVAGRQQSTPFTDVVPGTVSTAEGPDAMAPTDCDRPPASQAVPTQASDENVDIPRAGSGEPGDPFWRATITPCPAPTPTATQDGFEEQDTAVRAFVPGTRWRGPDLP